ncbi:MAG: uroporphyrinogen-III C-methyltransferase [Casimicrobiaceae bacterium]
MADPIPPEQGRSPSPDPAADLPHVEPGAPGVAPRPAVPRDRPPGSVSRGLLAATLAVAVLVAGAVWLDGRRTDHLLRTEVAQRLTVIDVARESSAKSQNQMASDLRDAQAKIGLLEARLAESQEQQAALEALYRDMAPSRDEIALSEIEQVLLVASQQLQLAGNVQAALGAMQLADAKLQRLDKPQLLPLRRALARDIDRLKGVPYVDVAGLSVKLDQATTAVDTLPLAMDERLPDPVRESTVPTGDGPAWRRLLREIWADIRQLVRIEVADRPAAPLVPPPQQYFLRENLKLRLLSARVALLNHDNATFKSDIGAADEWLRQYYDTRSPSVQAVQATLKQLAATPMSTDLPDLARTLDAARVLRLAAERAPNRTSGAEPSR